MALHEMGINHGDVAARNVIYHPVTHKWTIIDLGQASLNHVCIGPDCEELRDTAALLGVAVPLM